ncbi:telomeric repeat-binding factor 1 isoform X2 [Conger conger]|uniref:telomeric repeat-binding factor 1 isoform X2 n=1 Tax=Conger conger TaxID=82655 RepID=UPI002A59BADF|nr:telomeric repeat-binding factor 1 isoform X2 [Conger conger]
METQVSEDTGTLISNMTDDCVAFSDIEVVANGWMIDFFFISACRFFKQEKHEEFNKSLQSLEVIIEGTEKMKLDQVKKMQLCGFLSRVINGKRLDLQFESEKEVMPLMSALSIWKSFGDFVADEALYETIKKILFIQSAGVCLAQGNCDMALVVLEKLVEEYQMPEELKMKLCAIVKRKDVYHQCFVQFSYTRLVESINTFLDSVLKAHPSDFLLKTSCFELKAASKVVLSCRGAGVQEDTEEDDASGLAARCGEDSESFSGEQRTEASVNSADENQNHEDSASSELSRRRKRRLLPQHASPWKPESCKKLSGGIKRHTHIGVLPNRFSTRLIKDPNILKGAENRGTKRSRKRKWTEAEDHNLKAGVRRHGEGRWSQILLDFDFPDRTGVMLKDRWRTLKRLDLVG